MGQMLYPYSPPADCSISDEECPISRAVDSNMEEFQKRRKLTTDSGYGEDFPDSRRDSLNAEQCINRTSSLDSINEDDSNDYPTGLTESDQSDVFKTMADKFQSMNTRHCFEPKQQKHQLTLPKDTLSPENPEISSKTKEKRRRMTPVPSSVSIIKPSQCTPLQLPEQQASGRKILFVEEEDVDDIEKYNHEDDFICPDLILTSISCRKITEKRNSWHGVTEGENIAKNFRRATLNKTKSLDRGCEYPRRRKRFADMSIPSISLEELSIDNNNKPRLTRQRQLLSDELENNSRCCLFGNNNNNGNKTKTSRNLKKPLHKNNLPAWMQEAEADMTLSDTSTSSNSGNESNQSVEEETLSKKLQIPEINWEKLSAEKNKTNQLLSEQRKALNKQKNKASSRRRRKLTPSESPSHASLEKLSTLKTCAEEWKVTEEEEDELEEETNGKL